MHWEWTRHWQKGEALWWLWFTWEKKIKEQMLCFLGLHSPAAPSRTQQEPAVCRDCFGPLNNHTPSARQTSWDWSAGTHAACRIQMVKSSLTGAMWKLWATLTAMKLRRNKCARLGETPCMGECLSITSPPLNHLSHKCSFFLKLVTDQGMHCAGLINNRFGGEGWEGGDHSMYSFDT